jgi:hypothetical protein
MADIKEVIQKNISFKKGKPLATYKLVYDSPQNQLEPIYYWVLDFMENIGVKVEKIKDNFMASPGSGQFSEMGQKATLMQQQATKILADTNIVIKSIIQLIYDLKEFEIRLAHYEKANSENKKDKEEGMIALKNIWLDQVDLKRGRGSIHQMTYEMGYTTLRDAFLIANNIEDLDKMASKDGVINDQVKRVLIPRLSEFLLWKDISEREITNRFNIEKSYLKSQVQSLKLYTKWASPYLKAAEELRMQGFDNHNALVHAFSTSMFELNLLGTSEVSVNKSPDLKKTFGERDLKRKYFSVVIVTIKYRGHLGQKAGQGGQSGYSYTFGGRLEMTFDAYSLNSDEIKLIKKLLEDKEIEEGLSLVENNTEVALKELKDDIEKYTGDNKEEKKKEEKKKEDDINPFSAIFDFSKFFDSEKKKEEEIKTSKDIKKDDFIEESLRKEAAKKASGSSYLIYDIYKKAHGHASSPEGFDNPSIS